MRIFNIGSLNIDHVYGVSHFTAPGETQAAVYSKGAGGKGLNQSIALARAGCVVHHLGAVGEEGEFLVSLLKSEGVNVDGIQRSETPTGHAIIEVIEAGENRIMLFPGANHAIQKEKLYECLAQIDPDDLILLQNETSLIPELLQWAKENKISVAFNPAPMSDSVKEYDLQAVSILFLNEVEAGMLSGEKTPDRIMQCLTTRYPGKGIILTLGAEGAMYGDGFQLLRQTVYPTDVVDTTAAGDTFVGYYLSGVVKGLDTSECLDLAAKASSLTVSVLGAAASIPKVADVCPGHHRPVPIEI